MQGNGVCAGRASEPPLKDSSLMPLRPYSQHHLAPPKKLRCHHIANICVLS